MKFWLHSWELNLTRQKVLNMLTDERERDRLRSTGILSNYGVRPEAACLQGGQESVLHISTGTCI